MESHGRNYTNGQKLTASVQSKLNKLPEFSTRRCIYKVRRSLREVNKQAYTPMVVSIGPLHYKDESLLPMELHKLTYLKSFLFESRFNTTLDSCLRIVKDKETQIRESYANPTFHISSDEFTEMILIDSAFIIELCRRVCDPSLIKDDHIWGKPCMFNDVMRDIKLAENQLPFFILLDLYRTAFKPHDSIDAPYFTDLACQLLRVSKRKVEIHAITNEAKCCHLLDLLRCRYLPYGSFVVEDEDNFKNIRCPSAMSLYEAGVKFRADKSETSNWNDVHFDSDKGILTIPKLQVIDETESLLRNLVAFEQCHYLHPCKTYISDYQNFLDCLINVPEDVQVLVKKGIIDNWLGSDKDVSDMFNSLGDHVILTPSQYYYRDITKQLNSYCTKKRNYYRAILLHTYFKHPWAVISVIYAAILLVLTIMQVVAGIMSVPPMGKRP